MGQYIYPKADVELSKLFKELKSSSFKSKVGNVNVGALTIEGVTENYVKLVTTEDLTPEEVTSFEYIVTSHIANDPLASLKFVISQARDFGSKLIISFAANNVASGITQAGKTKAVADYLQALNYYISTGSLYEAMNEIDRLVADESRPEGLEPFVTNAVLNGYKAQILDYLT